jgi:hypothetical protein
VDRHAIQLLSAFQQQETTGWKLEEKFLKQFANMARQDPSPVVRLYLASAIQRLPFSQRWSKVSPANLAALCSTQVAVGRQERDECVAKKLTDVSKGVRG